MENIQLLLTPAIQAYLIGLIYRNTRTTCLSLSALCPWVSHDTLGRLLGCALSWSGRLWEVFACRLVKEGSYLVIDDTAWQRWAKKTEGVSPIWCGSVSFEEGSDKEPLQNQAADRRDISVTQAGIWLGTIKDAQSTSTDRTPASWTYCALFNTTGGRQSMLSSPSYFANLFLTISLSSMTFLLMRNFSQEYTKLNPAELRRQITTLQIKLRQLAAKENLKKRDHKQNNKNEKTQKDFEYIFREATN